MEIDFNFSFLSDKLCSTNLGFQFELGLLFISFVIIMMNVLIISAKIV